jgi:hypothetical protein
VTKSDNRALARSDRVTIAHALHCHFVPGHAHDPDTFRVLRWIIRRFDMHNISQAPSSLPVGIWSALDRIFPGDLLRSEHRAVRAIAQQLEAEKAAKSASDAIEGVLNGTR